jgi:hypothetical protein
MQYDIFAFPTIWHNITNQGINFHCEHMKTKRVNDIELLRSKLDKKQLCEFIRKECAYDDEFQQRLLALGAGSQAHTPSKCL